MRSKLIPLILILLLASCTMTKRRYLPGYKLNWEQKYFKTAPEQTTQLTPTTNKSVHLSKPVNTASDASPQPEKKFYTPVCAESFHNYKNTSGTKITDTKHITSELNAPKMEYTFYTPADSLNNKKVVCKEAKVSLTFGILTWTVPSALIFLGFLIAAPIAAGGNSFAYFIVIPFALLGGLFALVSLIIALTSGSTALDKIKEHPDKYTGKWKAIIGSLLAGAFLLGLILLLIIR